MVVDTRDHIHHAHGEADSQPALIGRPLALVSMGWSLELATQPMRDQTDSFEQSKEDLLQYQFELKLGDRGSLHDGLVAYSPAKGDDFNFQLLFALYGSSLEDVNPSSGLDSVLPAKNLSFSPYWINPVEYSSTGADAFVDAHTDKLQVYAALIDPFQSINGFSGILPTTTLTVPPWALEQAIKAMKTIPWAGPLLIPGNIPATPAATSSSSTTAKADAASSTATATLPIDAPPGTWVWMQPVADDSNATTQVFGLTPAPKEFAVADGLQTVVEGFLRSN